MYCGTKIILLFSNILFVNGIFFLVGFTLKQFSLRNLLVNFANLQRIIIYNIFKHSKKICKNRAQYTV